MAKKKVTNPDGTEVKTSLMDDGDAFTLLNDLFGGAVRTPGETEHVDVIRTGSCELDWAIGVGGWPRGRLVQLAGIESSGKTLLSLLAIATWQKEHPDNCAAFIDAEFTYDMNWAAKLGVDNERVLLVKSNDAAAIFTGLAGETKISSAPGKKQTKVPGLFDMIVAKQKLKFTHPITKKVLNLDCGRLGVIVLDSIANLNTPAEAVAAVGKVHMAQTARFLSIELKKIVPALARSNALMIAINQMRVDLGAMFGDPATTSGGRALRHACSLMVQVAPLNGEANVIMNNDETIVARRVRVKISKNKVGEPNKKAEYFVKFNEGIINKEEEMLRKAKHLGLVDGGGAYYNLNSFGFEVNCPGIDGTLKALELKYPGNNFFEQLSEKFYASLSTTVVIQPDDEEEMDGDSLFAGFDTEVELEQSEDEE